jgi:predicted MFS family arabinose efflux permease
VSDTSRFSAPGPFQVRSYRFQWPGDLLTSWAIEMEMLILGWYVLVETGSVVLLTLFASLLNLGTLIAPFVGVLGDRLGQRNVLFAMRSAYLALATSVTVLTFAGLLNPTYVLINAALVGLVRPSELGVRSALVAATVPHDKLTAAIGTSRTTSDSARVMGALFGAGLFVAFGIGRAYLAIVTFYLIGILLLFGVGPESGRPAAAAGAPRVSPWRDLIAGLLYIWRTPRLQGAMWLALLVNLTAFPFITGLMPYVAREVYHLDQTGLGYLIASTASGALIGSITLGVIGARLRVERIMLFATMIWYALLLVFAHLHTLGIGIACLVVVGFAQSMSVVTMAILLLRTSEPQYRGRVMGARMLVVYGHPVGLLAAGPLIQHIGYTASATLYCGLGIAGAAVILLRWGRDLIGSPEPTSL